MLHKTLTGSKLIASYQISCTKLLSNIVSKVFELIYNHVKNSFFPSTVIEWNKRDPNIRIFFSFRILKKKLLSFVRSAANSIFKYHSPKGIKFLLG